MKVKFIYIILILFSTIPENIIAQEYLFDVNYVFQEKQIHSVKSKQNKASIELPFFDDFSKQFGIPDTNLWIGNDVYINNTYSNNPVNIDKTLNCSWYITH